MNRHEAEFKLKKIFGIDHFYDEQWEAIDKIMKGQRVLMIQKTGFGKSLCYQFPATQFSGITVVFSPLIALMRDQVKNLISKGISAAFINSEQTDEENEYTIAQALKGKIKILYIAPERQENEDWVNAARQMNLSMVVIDEAHTISTWGHDFRPAFRRIIDLVQLLPASLPVLATTATATKRVQEDIEEQINGNLTTIRGSLIRDNFSLYVIKVMSEDEKMAWLADNINKLPGTGLIYAGTRVDTEVYSKWLSYNKIDSIEYNAGLDSETRKDIEQGLINNKWKCIISTNALGMGIDKSDIRFIIHTQIPASPIHYYQEIGRAGRDGKPAIIVLFYNEAIDSKDNTAVDYHLPKSFIEGARPAVRKYHRVIDLLQNAPLSEREIIKKANLKQTQVRVILADLKSQNIIKPTMYGKTKKYEYQYNAPNLNTNHFEQLRLAKMADLNSMVEYVYTTEPRMKFLCDFLDSYEQIDFYNCDNTSLPKLKVSMSDSMIAKIESFRETYFPILDVAESTSKSIKGIDEKLSIKIPKPDIIEVYKNSILNGIYEGSINFRDYSSQEKDVLLELLEKHIEKKSHLLDGYAASFYGVSNVGSALHRCKYENGGDYPDFLLNLCLKAFAKNRGKYNFDVVLYVPPTKSGDLVKNFAVKFAKVIKIPISHGLRKIRTTEEQKVFQNNYSKHDNVAGAFDIDGICVRNKSVVLIDDIYDSGATIKEIGKMLTEKGAKYIFPLVIAKTVGGTL